MKLRIRGDSLRLRVVRGELDELMSRGVVADRIRFPGGRSLLYRVHVLQSGEPWKAVLDEDGISIGIPRAEAAEWFRPECVGARTELAVQDGATLSLLLEKDFPCLVERPGEDDSDAFARPDEGAPPRC
jgi:hypothetical protein